MSLPPKTALIGQGRPEPGSSGLLEGHGHAHTHSHAHHSHAPDHIHPPAPPPVSILRMSLLSRLMIAGAASVVIWSAVFLAIRSPL